MVLVVMVEALVIIISMISSIKHNRVLRWVEVILHINSLHGFGL